MKFPINDLVTFAEEIIIENLIFFVVPLTAVLRKSVLKSLQNSHENFYTGIYFSKPLRSITCDFTEKGHLPPVFFVRIF